jgi:outer membrane protein
MDPYFKIIFLLIIQYQLMGQPILSLTDALNLAEQNAPELILLRKELELKKKELLFHQSSLRPELRLNGSLPNFTRIVAPVILPDGKEIFVYRSITFSRIGLEGNWNTPGAGTITLHSAIQKLNDYAFFPLTIGYQLPLPLLKKNQYLQKELNAKVKLQEVIIQKTIFKLYSEITQLYTECLLKEGAIQLLQQSYQELNDLATIHQKLLAMGHGNLIDLKNIEVAISQIEIEMIFANEDLTKSRLNLEQKIQLQNFKVIMPSDQNQYHLTDEIPDFLVLYSIEKELQQIQFDLNRRLATSEWGPSIGIQFTVGLNNSASKFNELLNRLQGQQTAAINFSVPLFNSGLKNKKIEMIDLENQIQTLKYDLEFTQIQLVWNDLKNSFESFKRALSLIETSIEIAEYQYQLTLQAYTQGELNWIELNQTLGVKNKMNNEKLMLRIHLIRIYFQVKQLLRSAS